LALLSCNRYEMFLMAGYEQATYANEVDILFVVDNSLSMYDEASALALNFNSFVDRLVDPEQGTGVSTEGLTDAVDNYLLYVTQRGRFLDYQLALTTTSADPMDGLVDPGEAGTLSGDPSIVSEDLGGDVSETFRANVMCDTTCWPEECQGDNTTNCIPYDPYYECGDDPGNQVSWDYLACVCGDSWTEPDCGSGTEEGLESALLALCRAVEDPPQGCWDHDGSMLAGQGEAGSKSGAEDYGDWYGSSLGLIREDARVIVVFVTDEGDGSRMLVQGEEDPEPYLDIFDEFDNDITFVAIGPNYDPEDLTFECNSGGGTNWGTVRYQLAAERTGGFFQPIEEKQKFCLVDDQDIGVACTTATDCEPYAKGASTYSCTEDCAPSDFAAHLESLGDLLNALLNQFPLRSIPDPDTILVFVDEIQIEESYCIHDCEVDSTGEPVYGDGWTYETGENAVYFHGTAVPDYNAAVRIYYRPVSDLPRSLPF